MILDWDSNFWGLQVARVHSARAITSADVDFLLLPVDDDELNEAVVEGFEIVDFRVTLDRRAAPETSQARLVREDDVDLLAEIARVSHRQSRFYRDEGFPDDRCDDFYEEWLRNSCAGWADAVFTMDFKDRPCGYATVSADKEGASIGLVAVAEGAQGYGFGASLIRACVDYAHSEDAPEIEVVTQGANVPAIRVYEACGFRVACTEVWLHGWNRP